MITKQEFIESLAFEIKVIKHLGEKVKPDTFEFKPTEGQRTLHELMQYIAMIIGAGVDVIKAGNTEAFKTWSETTPKVTLENFGELMDKQEKQAREVVGAMTEEELNTEVDVYGKRTRALHLLNGPLKWATAYKMQFFLYLKQTGNTELNTMNLWAGMDPQPKG